MLTETQREKIKATFQAGTLKVRSVSPKGSVEWKRVENVIRNEVPWERILAVAVAGSEMVLTGGHPVYTGLGRGDKSKAEDLKSGDLVLSVVGDSTAYLPVESVRELPSRKFMFDITVEDWHRFSSAGTRVVLGNSPDKFYHFRPPESEGNIGAYNRVFGQIWEDVELLEYIERGLDWWNMMPPMTEGLDTVDKLVNEKPVWRTAILWAALSHACFALATNWVAEEFSLISSTFVQVTLPSGRTVDVTIEELYEICTGSSPEDG
jgi:hypothetical protein